MRRKLPADAFSFWASLPDGERTFSRVAAEFGVDKSNVSRTARRERWRERLRNLEPKVCEKVEERLVERLADYRARHIRAAERLIEKGLEGLERFDLVEVKDCIAAIKTGAELERKAREEPDKRVMIEHVLAKRAEALLGTEPQPRQLSNGRPRLEISIPTIEELEAEHAEAGGE